MFGVADNGSRMYEEMIGILFRNNVLIFNLAFIDFLRMFNCVS